MVEYIEREAVHQMIVDLQKYVWTSPISTETRIAVSADEVHFKLDKIPAIDVAPVRHGHWTGKPTGRYEVLKCSICGDCSPTAGIMPRFCPNCGAKMDRKEGNK